MDEKMVEFLTACLDEDEAVARAMGHHEVDDIYYKCPALRTEDEAGDLEWGEDACNCGLTYRQARALREIEAKRAIVAKAIEWDGDPNDYGQYHHACALLASVYADRPGYREKWRP